jgi:hypothetical protein
MKPALVNNLKEQHSRHDEDSSRLTLIALLPVIKEVMQRALSARKRITENNPLTSGGLYFYSEGVRALRDLLKVYGFERLSLRNVELTVNFEKGIAIYLCSGCEQTGSQAGFPQSRTPKGDFTLEYFDLKFEQSPNYDLFPEAFVNERLKNRSEFDVWFLLHKYNKSDDTITAELLRPKSYSRNGYVTGFYLESRIPIEMNNEEIVDSNANFNQEIDFDINERTNDNV